MPHILTEEDIFTAAIQLPSADARDSFLDAACGEDQALRQRIDHLIAAHDSPESSLEPAFQATRMMPAIEKVGSVIGPYKLREQLGEGGMGVVYVAEQEKPVGRKVALKIIKPGMASTEVIARFEAERQALAMMEHPHIARMLDAGTTQAGQPFFVMELVHGVSITQFCDQQELTNCERLQLFVQVCRAVQHAHQKGVIHRDIKPSNVLVADIDGAAIPKVIDFGVAKAVGHKLTDGTIYTQFSQMVGTPLYMSPEQTKLGVADLDTRSDVYSLGVLLYELLTGGTPFNPETLKNAGFDEFRRMIREDEPPRPSDMVSTLQAKALSTVASHRQTEPRKFGESLRGELDWIVMKSLEKDRNRRYESASAFAADVERFLSGDAVQACPPSTIYRIKKFAQRNKGQLLTATFGAALLLIALTVGVSAKLKGDSLLRQLTADVDKSLTAARTAIETNDLAVARQQIGEANGRLASAGQSLPQLMATVKQLSAEIDDRREQQQRLQSFEQLARDAMDSMFIGGALDGEKQAAQALDLYGVLSDEDWLDRLHASYLTKQQQNMVQQTAYEILLLLADHGVRWGTQEEKVKRTTVSLQYLQRAEAFHSLTRAFYWVRSECQNYLNDTEKARQDRKLFRSTAATTAFDYFLPGHTAGWQGDRKEAIRSYEAALRLQPDHFNSLLFLAMRLSADGRKGEAAEVYRACLALRPDHVLTLRNRALLLAERGEHEEAIELTGKAIQLKADSASCYGVRGSSYLAQGQLPKALADYDKAVDIVRSDNFSDTETAVNVYNHRAELFHRMGQTDRALEDLNAAVAMIPKAGGHETYLYAFKNRAMLLEEKGEYVKALADVEEALQIAGASKMPGTSVAHAHLQRGRIYYQTQRKPEAIEDFNKALGLASHQKDEFIREIRFFRGRALFDVDRPQEGVRDLSAVIAMVPKEPTTYWVSAHNQLSWNLVTCSDAAARDLPRALELARKAVELEPKNAEYWNTLGVAQYRSGDFTAAITSLNNSVELGSVESEIPCNALFLAMAHWQLGDHDAAREWYEKGVKWTSDNNSTGEELARFRAETEELLGIEPEAPIKEKHDGQLPEPVIPSEKTSLDDPPTRSD